MPRYTYTFGEITSIFIAGAGWFKPGSVVDGREVFRIMRADGRFYLLSLDGFAPNVIREHDHEAVLHVNYAPPGADDTTLDAGTSNDTVTAAPGSDMMADETGSDTIAG